MIETIAFALFAAITVGCALGVVLVDDAIGAILAAAATHWTIVHSDGVYDRRPPFLWETCSCSLRTEREQSS